MRLSFNLLYMFRPSLSHTGIKLTVIPKPFVSCTYDSCPSGVTCTNFISVRLWHVTHRTHACVICDTVTLYTGMHYQLVCKASLRSDQRDIWTTEDHWIEHGPTGVSSMEL
jgi:hypothetical protein